MQLCMEFHYIRPHQSNITMLDIYPVNIFFDILDIMKRMLQDIKNVEENIYSVTTSFYIHRIFSRINCFHYRILRKYWNHVF